MSEKRDIARKIADDLAELERQAKAEGLAVLAYLIEMARLEAANAARGF